MWNEDIIKSDEFYGLGFKYKYGNLLWRLKMQVCYILLCYERKTGENKYNPDNYAENISPNYVKKNLKLEELQHMGNSKPVRTKDTPHQADTQQVAHDLNYNYAENYQQAEQEDLYDPPFQVLPQENNENNHVYNQHAEQEYQYDPPFQVLPQEHNHVYNQENDHHLVSYPHEQAYFYETPFQFIPQQPTPNPVYSPEMEPRHQDWNYHDYHQHFYGNYHQHHR